MNEVSQDEVSGWFESLYEQAADDPGSIPWVRLEVHPGLHRWLHERDPVPRTGETAVVVACGLGDDAVELAARGYEVTAFDIAPTAIGRARERFPDAAVDWQVADLRDLPMAWLDAFDLVIEVFTVQAVPPEHQAAMAAHVASLVGPVGTLVVVALVADEQTPEGPPWPLTADQIADVFAPSGLVRTWAVTLPAGPGPQEFTRPLLIAEYRRK